MSDLVLSLNPAQLADLPPTLLWIAAGSVAFLLLLVIFFVKPEETEPVTDEPEVRSRVARKKRRR